MELHVTSEGQRAQVFDSIVPAPSMVTKSKIANISVRRNVNFRVRFPRPLRLTWSICRWSSWWVYRCVKIMRFKADRSGVAR
jgi:hypothetical protein